MLANDVTQRLQYIAAIEVQNNKLHEIAWIQSHVVRAPLARIMGLVDLIKNHSLSETEIGDYFIHISNSVEELDAIVKEIVKKTEQAQLNIE
jgi:signal transduction histidine kinase